MELDDDDEPSDYDPMANFLDRLVKADARIWAIDGGYKAFAATYPCLCGTQTLDQAVPMPHHVSAQPACSVFMGSRAVKLAESTLRDLGVRFVIVSADRPSQHEANGVAYLLCDVKDEDSFAADEKQNMDACFDACIEFINGAHKCETHLLRVGSEASSSAELEARFWCSCMVARALLPS